jgi:hypothetical protein
MEPWYTTRETVLRATDASDSVRGAAQVDRAIAASSRSLDRLVSRPVGTFAPWVGTRFFDWPHGSQPYGDQILFGSLPLHSATSLTSGGVAIVAADYLLRPDTGPPYEWVEIDAASDASLTGGDTWQGNVSMAGTWGILGFDTAAGTITAAVSTTTASTLPSSGSLAAAIGVGAILLIGGERVMVTARTAVTSGQVTGGALAAARTGGAVAVSDGFGFTIGEMLLIGAERVVIEEIAGNTLYVQRAAYGSILAAHDAGTTIYTYRSLTVARGQLGTTATTHDSGATVSLYSPRSDIEQAVIALTLLQLAQEQSGYARGAAGGTAQRPTLGVGVADVVDRVVRAYRPKLRHTAV